MNRKLTYIIITALALISFTATAQVHVGGNVFGGGNLASVGGKSTVTINQEDAVVTGDVYGGGALAHVDTTNNQNIISSVTLKRGTVRNIYGGGLGDGTHPAKVFGPVKVTVEGGTADTVFGCNNLNGAPQSTVQVYIEGGIINHHVFGGGNLASTPDAVAPVVNINGGEIGHDVYGGGALANTGGSTVNVMAGTIAGDVYGGALGDGTHAAAVNGPVTVNIGSGTEDAGVVTITGGNATIGGSVFGCNNAAGTPKDDVTVNIYRTHHETVNYYPDPVPSTPADLNVTDPNATEYNAKFALIAVYGGGNKASYIPNAISNKITVNVYGCDENTIKTVYGGGNAADVGVMEDFLVNTNLNIYGGRFDRVFGGGNGDGDDDPTSPNYNPGANISGTATTQIKGGLFRQVFGGSNHKGDIGVAALTIEKTGTCPLMLYESFGGANEAVIHGNVTTTLACSENPIQMHAFYGGSNLADIIDGDVTLHVYGGIYENVFGGSKGVLDGTAANIQGDVTLNLFGGTMTNAFGGCDANGNITGKITVNMLDQGDCSLIVRNIYGAGRDASYTPSYPVGSGETRLSPVVNLIHGTVSKNGSTDGNVYGGGYGGDAIVTSNPVVNVGYDASMATSLATIIPAINSITKAQVSVEGNVYGGGEAAPVSGGTTVTVQKAATTSTLTQVSTAVGGDVYGGGNLANVSGSTTVGVTGGTVTGDVYGGGALANVGGSGVTLAGGTVRTLYGGGMGGSSAALVEGDAQVTVNSGTINGTEIATNLKGGVFGGCNVKGTVKGSSTVLINGAVGSDGNKRNIYGGGLGENTNVVGDVAVKIGANVFGDVYGGSAKGLVNYEYNNDATPTTSSGDTTGVTLNSGVVSGDIYGGGHGLDDKSANVGGAVTVLVNGGSVNNVFGCNNLYGAPKSTVKVNINSNVAANVFGGGNLAAYSYDTGNYPEVNINHGTIGGSVFGGGKGKSNDDSQEPGMVTGNPKVTIGDSNASHYAVVTGNVYGGGDAAKVVGTTTVNYNDNNPSSTVAKLFGGGNAANVSSTATVTMTQGKVTAGIYGGCNTKGNVGGAVNVRISGGTLGIEGMALTEGIYGGGYGKDTETGDDVTVTIGYNSTNPTIWGDVYGGSALGKVSVAGKTTKVDYLNGTLHGTIYGGGMGDGTNAALVNGATEVAVGNGSISGGVYGGCNERGTVVGNVTVGITKGTVGTSTTNRANVHGGGLGANTATQGNVTVNIASNNASEGPTIYGDLYGGSGFGQVSASDKLTQVNFYKGTINGDVYGGGLGEAGKPAEVSGNVEVNIKAGVFKSATGADGGGRVFGCNNANGTPKGDVAVNIYATDHGDTPQTNAYPTGEWNATTLANNTSSQTYAIGAVYGGGNEAAYIPATDVIHNTTVHIYNCNNTIEDVYGGGNAADVGKTGAGAVTANTNVIIDGGRIKHVFGGGNGAGDTNPGANIYGTATTTLYAGVINQVFGGSNAKGNIHTTHLNLAHDNNNTCDMFYGEVFGGGNLAPIVGDLVTTVDCGAGNLGDFYGGANEANITGNVTLNIKGGTFNNVFGGSKGVTDGTAANILDNASTTDVCEGNVTLNLYGGTITNAFGGSNLNGNIDGVITVNILDHEGSCPLNVTNIYGAGNLTAYTPKDVTSGVKPTSPVVNLMHIKNDSGISGNVYGGAYGANATVTANPQVTIGYGTSLASYIPSGYSINEANRRVVVAGNVFGGGDLAPVVGTTKVIIQKDNSSATSLFGGGNQANVGGSTVDVLGGNLSAGVYGGCNTSGTVSGNIAVNIKSNLGTSSAALAQGIYGGGYGKDTQTSGTVTVTVGDGSTPTIYSDVYGGSAFGQVGASDKLTKVDFKNGQLHGTLYGGGKGDDTNAAEVTGPAEVSVSNGTVTGGVYGGCNVNGIVKGNTTVGITGGTVGVSNNTNTGIVYGGGLGQNTKVKGNVAVNIGTSGSSTGATIYGDVYGGSAKGLVNCNDDGTALNTGSKTDVTLNVGAINGDLYGGGHGIDNALAHVYGPVVVTTKDGSVNNVFGCNNAAGAPQGTVKVDINGGTISTNVYGGGNHAYYGGTPDVNILLGTINGKVFGGGNDITTANEGVNGSDVEMTNGTVKGGVYGGCNERGTVKTSSLVKLNGGIVGVSNNINTGIVYGGGLDQNTKVKGDVAVTIGQSGSSTGATIYGDVYGGSAKGMVNCNDAGSAQTTNAKTDVTLNVGAINGDLYGGGHGPGNENAHVWGPVVVNVKNGSAKSVYGGNNVSGTPKNTIKVVVEGGTVEYVYGGGNQAAYVSPNVNTASPEVTIKGTGKVTHDVFGGGLGNSATVTGYTLVKLQGGANIGHEVYGGGNAGQVNGKSEVKIEDE